MKRQKGRSGQVKIRKERWFWRWTRSVRHADRMKSSSLTNQRPGISWEQLSHDHKSQSQHGTWRRRASNRRRPISKQQAARKPIRSLCGDRGSLMLNDQYLQIRARTNQKALLLVETRWEAVTGGELTRWKSHCWTHNWDIGGHDDRTNRRVNQSKNITASWQSKSEGHWIEGSF